MKGYKIFGPNYTCRDYKFQDENKIDGNLEICARGFHFCPRAVDCLHYYNYEPTNAYAEVESQGIIQTKDDKVACLELKIIRRLTYEEFGELLTGMVKSSTLECSFVKGKKEGICKEWYNNGQLASECKYINGLRDGIYKEWRPNGQLSDECNYKEGQLHGIYKRWTSYGTLLEEYNYKEGTLHGIYKRWNTYGQLIKECNYIGGLKEGIFKEWNTDGQLIEECNYIVDKLHGIYKRWNTYGTLIKECNYTNGVKDY